MNSSIASVNQFITVFGVENIACLLGDREFLGEAWFSYLKKQKIPCRMRIKWNMKIARTAGIFVPAGNLFRSLPIATYCSLIGRRHVCGHRLGITGGRLPSGEYIIVGSSDISDSIMDDYQKRWKIERSFAWMVNDRRHSRDYEVLTACSEAMIHISMIRLLLKRLA